jgi:hypothetical protein
MALLDQVINEMRQVKFGKKKAKSSNSFRKIKTSRRSLKEGALKEIVIQAYDDWMNSENAPMDDEHGDDNLLLQKAMRHLQSMEYGNIPPEQKIHVAQAMVDMLYDDTPDPNLDFINDPVEDDMWGETTSTFGKALLEKKVKKPAIKKVKFGSGKAKGVKRKMFETDVSGPLTPQEDASIERLANQVAMQVVKDAEQFLRHVYNMEQEEFAASATEQEFVSDNIRDHVEFYVEQFNKDLQKRVVALVEKQWRDNNNY